MIEIGGLQKTTLIDFPGRLACTIFLCGCNFRCPWCYSPELVLPKKIKGQRKISEKELFEFLKKRKGLLEGVVICGGEPTLAADLPKFCQKIKKMSYLIKLDTNGSNPEVLRKLIKQNLVDYVAMDVKLPKQRYSELFGKVGDIEKSIKILKEGKIDYEFRTTVVPTILNKEDILKIAQWLKLAKKYYLQNFRPEKTIDPKLEKIKPYSKEILLEIKDQIKSFFEICQIRI